MLNFRSPEMPSPTTNNVVPTIPEDGGEEIDDRTEFTLFPTLPKELRLQIVETAIEDVEQRIFVVVSSPEAVMERHNKTPRGKVKARVAANKFSVPSFLHVNKESRGTALTVYDLSFSDPFNGKPIYFNFAKDKLFFASHADFRALQDGSSCSAWKKIERKLRYLVIGDDFFGHETSLEIIAKFHKLRVFAHHSHNEGYRHHRISQSVTARLKRVLEENWTKSHDYEELIAATYREAALIPEPVVRVDYELPKIEVLSIEYVDSIVARG